MHGQGWISCIKSVLTHYEVCLYVAVATLLLNMFWRELLKITNALNFVFYKGWYAHELAKVQNWINCEHHLGVRDAQFVVGQGVDQWWWWHLPSGVTCSVMVTSWPQLGSVFIRHVERNHWSLISTCLLGSDSLMTRCMISASKWWMLKRKGRQWYMFVKKDL